MQLTNEDRESILRKMAAGLLESAADAQSAFWCSISDALQTGTDARVVKLTDADREFLIGQLAIHVGNGSQAERRYFWSLYANLIHGRSAAAVRALELKKGLRAA